MSLPKTEGLTIPLQQLSDGAITTDMIQQNDTFTAQEFLASKKDAIQTMKTTLTPQSDQLKAAQTAKLEAEKQLQITTLSEEQIAQYTQAKTTAEAQIATFTSEMQTSLKTIFADAGFYSQKQAVQTADGTKPGEVVYFKTTVVDTTTNALVDKYILVGTKELFEGTFVQGILDGLDEELAIKTADILGGFQNQEAALKAQIGAPEQQGMFAKRIGIPAGVGFFTYLSDKLRKSVAGDETQQGEAKSRFEGLLGKATKLLDTVGSAGEKVGKMGGDSEITGVASKVKGIGVSLIALANTYVGSEAIADWVTKNGGGVDLFGGWKGAQEKVDGPTNNEFCKDDVDLHHIYATYCEKYADMDIPASFPDQATSAATKNNNPGNIKMPSSDGPVAVALRTLGISYEQGTPGQDGGYFMKFANAGDGYFAMFILLGTLYKDRTLGYGLSLYANGGYNIDEILGKLPQPPQVTPEMSYKELNDEQFLALIDIQRKNEDGKMYALMEDTPVADESDGSTDDDIFEPTYTDEGEEIIG